MPGKTKKKKGKKGCNRSSPALKGNLSIFLGTLSPTTTEESAPEEFWGGSGCSSGKDSAESYRPLTNQESWCQGDQSQGPDTAGSYYPYWDHQEYYGQHDWKVYQKKNLGMEVEEALHRNSPSEMDTVLADSESEEPPAPKVYRANTNRRRMPGKGKKKGKKGSKRTSSACAGRHPVFLGTLLTPAVGERGPDAEARESHGATSDNHDWYNDFQTSESDDVDSYYTTERPSLILASLYGSAAGEGPTGRFYEDQHSYED
ncbi:hypothetical protein P4O66_001328 [Electrophorus voltai]|uniref:Uncharacterized protein n=1 Tax=Electrophorus voltai TaxID=2609070 RepID=A0AAD8Z7P4_9TELE|nr:hypothetical protein P4O66_001328 [Electrophorus voltai]